MRIQILSSQENQGTVNSLCGSIVDGHFPRTLSSLQAILKTRDKQQVVEGMTHLNSSIIRRITLTRTLSCRSPVTDTGHPLQVPVGFSSLGRMFNVFGKPIDGLGPLLTGDLRPNLRRPVPLLPPTTTSEVFTTGIKGIDVPTPVGWLVPRHLHIVGTRIKNLD